MQPHLPYGGQPTEDRAAALCSRTPATPTVEEGDTVKGGEGVCEHALDGVCAGWR